MSKYIKSKTINNFLISKFLLFLTEGQELEEDKDEAELIPPLSASPKGNFIGKKQLLALNY